MLKYLINWTFLVTQQLIDSIIILCMHFFKISSTGKDWYWTVNEEVDKSIEIDNP